MSEYIKKTDVRHLLLHNEREAALAKLDELESVDAVPVVRCAECKNWLECLIRTDDDGERYSRCCLNGIAVGESFYCADGERRTE